jgi:DUF4097 and DUF4098 domain-containing protein YvlB
MRTLATLGLAAFLATSTGCRNGHFVLGTNFGDWEQSEPHVDEHALPTEGIVALDVATAHGDVDVVASDDRVPRVVATMSGFGPTLAAAEDVLARSRVEIVDDGDVVRVRLVTEPREGAGSSDNERGSVSVDFLLHVPRGMDVAVDCGSGDIDVSGGIGAAQLETGYGDVDLAGAEGDVTASSGSGSVSVRDVEGGKVELESNYGDVVATNVIATALALRSGSGDVALTDARADAIDLHTSYGDVDVRTVAGMLTAQSGSGSVEIAACEGAVDASSSYGDVDVEGVLARLRATTGSGDVGVVALVGSDPADGWKLESSYGDVDLFAPADFACKLDARTSYGDIECGYALTIEAGMKSDERLAGTINGGGGLVELNSGSGDVRLRVR